jgi:prepilin-type N-terminal cleavage/methylation domain-containing protein
MTTNTLVVRAERRDRARRHRRRGFSLLELVIVMGIIVVLASLVMSVAATMAAASEDRELRNAMKLLDNAVAEWERVSDRALTYGIDNPAVGGAKYDIQELPASDVTKSEPKGALRVFSDTFVKYISQNAATQGILKNIDRDLLRQEAGPGAGLIQVLMDPWDKPIVIVFPGRKWLTTDGAPALTRDDDGTLRTEVEKRYGVCKNQKILFVSFGPDERPGDIGETDHTDPAYKDTLDNVYSYEPVKP